MKFLIQKNSNIPFYRQIYNQIVQRIQSGLLNHNEKLPSLRIVAEELDISVLTIRKAYKCLEDAGYVSVKPGKGVFVKKKSTLQNKKEDQSNWQHSLGVNVVRSQYLINRHKGKYDFSKAVVYPKLLPNLFLAEEMQKVFRQNDSILSTYGPIEGDKELRFEIANHLFEYQKIKVNGDHIIITSGVQQGIDLVAQALLKPGDTVIVESPCYGGALDVFSNKGINIVPIEMDKHGIRSDLIEEECIKNRPTLVYVNPSYQNPTGISMSIQRRKELVELAEHYQFFILEDDSFSDIYFNNHVNHLPIKYFDQHDHVIYIKGFSKTLAPGIRVASMVAKGPVFDWLYAVKASMDVGSPLLIQKAILPFLRTDRMKKHVEKLRTALQIRRDISVDIFSTISDKVQFEIPKGGFNLWLTLQNQFDSFSLLEKANAEDISFLPGSACFVNDQKLNTFRISFSLISDSDLTVGLTKLCRIIKSI